MRKEYLSQEQGLSDLLNYAHFVDEGVILNKDGAYLTTFQFRGPDINSATSGELDALTHSWNRMLTFLEDGWMLHVDEVRIPSVTYPEEGKFPDPVSWLIDEERRQMYEEEGQHFENLQFLTFVWKFPMPLVKTARHWFVEGLSREEGKENLSTLLNRFNETVERCIAFISTQLILQQLRSKDLFSFLNTCISGNLASVEVPPEGCYIDVALGRHDVIGGYLPKVGDKYVYTLSLIGYANQETMPGILEDMSTYPMVYRWSNRFVPLSETTAEREIKRYHRNWNNKVKGMLGLLRETVTGKPSSNVNKDALAMAEEAEDAMMTNGNRNTRFGYWTSDMILIHPHKKVLDQVTKDLSKYLEQRGFACQLETVNAMETWRGSIPGHGACNLRRLFIDAINLAHFLPLHSIWAGAAFSSPASLLPPKSPPVFYAATTGKTPFRFHIDVSDVGHTLIAGPTGAGKTFFLQFLITQFQRYSNTQVFIFDKDFSHRAFTAALAGNHYDIGDARKLEFCPLADLASETTKMRAEQFIENLIYLQNTPLTPEIRADIHTAIEAMAEKLQLNNRTLSVFCSMIQNQAARSALKYYTMDGTMKMLDAQSDNLKISHLQTFEMGWLLSQRAEVFLPVLMYIFDQIESRLEQANGRRPTLIILEEAWLYIGHEVFAAKLRDWLKTLRKKNARVIFATQSLSDLYDPETKTLTRLTSAIMESCPTKIYLPNQKMEIETRELYGKMGLNDRQIEIIEHIGIPKRHYYIATPEGNRLIDLGLTEIKSIALHFLGLSPQSGGDELIACQSESANKDDWLFTWLVSRGFPHWAEKSKEYPNYRRNL